MSVFILSLVEAAHLQNCRPHVGDTAPQRCRVGPEHPDCMYVFYTNPESVICVWQLRLFAKQIGITYMTPEDCFG